MNWYSLMKGLFRGSHKQIEVENVVMGAVQIYWREVLSSRKANLLFGRWISQNVSAADLAKIVEANQNIIEQRSFLMQ